MRKSTTTVDDETASLLNANPTTETTTEKMMMMRGSISREEEDSSKSSSSSWFPFASKLVGVKVLVLIAVAFYAVSVMTVTKTTTETSSPRMLIEGKKGELETLKHVLENARLFLMRKRGGEMEINGDGALLISTTSSKPSLGEDDAMRASCARVQVNCPATSLRRTYSL